MHKYDLLLAPTLAVPPFVVGLQGPARIDRFEVEPFEWLHFTYVLNFTGQPAASIAAGWTDDGLTVAPLIIVGVSTMPLCSGRQPVSKRATLGRSIAPAALFDGTSLKGAAPWRPVTRPTRSLRDVGFTVRQTVRHEGEHLKWKIVCGET